MNILSSLLIFVAAATVAFGEPVFLGSHSDSDGTTLQWQADSAQIALTESWDGIASCPFELADLIQTALAHVAQAPDSQSVRLDAIFLQRADRAGHIDTLKDKWFLTVSFSRTEGQSKVSVRLLTDGTIIKPEAK